jgi:dGTPase
VPDLYFEGFMGSPERFQTSFTADYIKDASLSLADYATPYPKTSEEEGRKIIEEGCRYRNAFSRDRDRIVHCSSFRKLQGKTQIFVSGLNPSIRNRLTHTLEVWQIATSLAKTFRVNVDLVEAISLGHDIGHTPFGHSGEGELGNILDEETNRRFNHNEQSVIVAALLEESPKQVENVPSKPVGLNLSQYTLEGIYKHTLRFKRGCQDERLRNWFDITYGSIEAQIVHIADDIAQNTHDLADLWANKNIGYQHLLPIMSNYSTYFGNGDHCGKGGLAQEELDKFIEKFLKDGFSHEFSSYLVGTLTNDVRKTGISELNNKYNGKPGEYQFIKYSAETEKFVEDLKNLTHLTGINSDEVNQTNSRGRHIIRSLYDLYCDDAYCLPLVHKGKLSEEIQRIMEDTMKYKKTNITQKDDIRIICDYIASLTDQEAIERFRAILT